MAFVSLHFNVADTVKIVTYTFSAEITPWTIKSVKIGADTINRTRWRFTNVDHDPSNSSNLIGTLHFDGTNLDPNDPLDAPLLLAIPNATLSFNVDVNGSPKPLTVYMN